MEAKEQEIDEHWVIVIRSNFSWATDWFVIEKEGERESSCNYLKGATTWSKRGAEKEAKKWERADRTVSIRQVNLEEL